MIKKFFWWYYPLKLTFFFRKKHKINIRTAITLVVIYVLKLNSDYDGCIYKKHSYVIQEGCDSETSLKGMRLFFKKVDFNKLQEICDKEKLYICDIRMLHYTLYFTSYADQASYMACKNLYR